jgi:predicted AlkP superfamily pyrophosphatase or phosphodiesterase
VRDRRPANPVLALLAVGLTPDLLRHMPRLSAVADAGFCAPLDPLVPAVTCTMQSTFLTGATPAAHGVVGNGWYFRDLGEVLFWRQHNALVQGDKLWDVARRADSGFTVANLCWWYAMGADVDLTLTPRPVYHADGRKEPDCYTDPPSLRDELTAELGRFPLFTYWGPTAGIASSEWLAQAAIRTLRRDRPDLTLLYLPHLDYDLQRFGPDGPEAVAAARELDRVAGDVIDAAREREVTVVVLSEYGITPVRRPVALNRVLREAGLLRVYTQDGMEHLDPWTSRAFAVVDHQLAHVYVRDPDDVARVRDLLGDVPGVERLLVGAERAEAHLDHERSGEVVAIADADAWFSYYYWLDDDRAPDYARLVEIHRKPGYDPVELFFDPASPLVKVRAARALARKKLGFRYLMDVVGLDASIVRGSHGRLPARDGEGPLLLSDDASLAAERVPATAVRDLLLRACGVGGG